MASRAEKLEAAAKPIEEALRLLLHTAQGPLADLVRACHKDRPHNHDRLASMRTAMHILTTAHGDLAAALALPPDPPGEEYRRGVLDAARWVEGLFIGTLSSSAQDVIVNGLRALAREAPAAALPAREEPPRLDPVKFLLAASKAQTDPERAHVLAQTADILRALSEPYVLAAPAREESPRCEKWVGPPEQGSESICGLARPCPLHEEAPAAAPAPGASARGECNCDWGAGSGFHEPCPLHSVPAPAVPEPDPLRSLPVQDLAKVQPFSAADIRGALEQGRIDAFGTPALDPKGWCPPKR